MHYRIILYERNGYMNIIKPGADNCVVTTSIFDMVIFMDDRFDKTKRRYSIVHKNRKTRYADQWTDSVGHPVTVVTEAVFNDVRDVLTSTARQIQDLKRDVENYKSQCEAYKLTIETLRKNGVID